MAKQVQEVRDPDLQQLNVRVDEGLHRAAKIQSFEERAPLSDLVRRALFEYLDGRVQPTGDARRALDECRSSIPGLLE